MSKKKTTKKFKLNPLAVVALVLCALIAVYCGTTAWITSGVPLNPLRFTTLQDFNYTVQVSKTKDVSWADSDGIISYTKSNIADLENLRFRIKQEGNGVAFTRVRISQEWMKADGTRLQGEYNLPFTIADETLFFDNRFNDGYVYYMGDFPVDEYIEVFSGLNMANLDTSVIPNDVTLNVSITVDAVQFNRYQQFWGIDDLPWR